MVKTHSFDKEFSAKLRFFFEKGKNSIFISGKPQAKKKHPVNHAVLLW